MQSVYEWEFRDNPELDQIVERNIHAFEKDVDKDYIHKVVYGIRDHWDEINEAIVEAAPEWPLDQVARVDKNILRVAIYEMLFDEKEDVPPRVSINEAIEIGKTFGSESSPKFINGALGFIYRKHAERLEPRDAR